LRQTISVLARLSAWNASETVFEGHSLIVARPRKKLPAGALETVRDLAEQGASEVEIARGLGLSYRTWVRLRAENEDLRAAYEEARRAEEGRLVGRLFKVAMDDGHQQSVTAAIVLLKCRHGYRDQGPTGDGADAPRVNLVFNLPAPLSGDQYQRLIEQHPGALPAPSEAA
jgi:hypothetical protein